MMRLAEPGLQAYLDSDVMVQKDKQSEIRFTLQPTGSGMYQEFDGSSKMREKVHFVSSGHPSVRYG